MTEYYEVIEHTNTTDEKEIALKLASSLEEAKTLVEIVLTGYTNSGRLSAYLEREMLIKPVRTDKITYNNPVPISMNIPIPVGSELIIYLQNVTAGTNASIYGWARYNIT